MRNARATIAVFATLLLAGTTAAQRVGSLADWKQRVLDPATVGVEPYPGGTFNMKFTIDRIRLDETKARMAVYVMPLEDLEPTAQFFAKQLGTPVQVVDRGSLGPLREVRAKPDDARRAGVSVRVEASEWATGKGQIWLRQDPPAAAPAP